MVDFVSEWSSKTEQPVGRLLDWLALRRGKYYDWKRRYGTANDHNGTIPRDHWLTDEERQAILDFHERHPLEGYRRLTFMMIDADAVCVSPSTTYRVLSAAGRLDRWNPGPSKKGTGFQQPTGPHEHWHTDIAYVNVGGTFYYLCSILDGYSRAIVHWELRESMKEADVEVVVQRALEHFPGVTPRLISDNGPQFVARDFKTFIREVGMTHVRTAPYYPQSNGKLERYHRTIKTTTIRPACPSNYDEADQLIGDFVVHYNTVRLHSAIDYITPADKLAGRADDLLRVRDERLEQARQRRRQQHRRAAA